MQNYTLADVSDAVLLRNLAALVTQDRITTATLLAHIAEVDARKLYVPAGYPSMHAYCVDELRLSEDSASKRIQAARAARRFPVLFTALAEGRLHLGAVCLLSPHLTPENLDELIEVATHRRKSEIEGWLARDFGTPEVLSNVRAVMPMTCELPQHAPGHVGAAASALAGKIDEHALGHVGGSPANVPLPSPEHFLLQVTIAKSTHDKLRHAQALMSHALPSGDIAQVVDRALDVLIERLERRKLGAASGRWRGRRAAREDDPEVRPSRGARHVPAAVRRAVWERDQGQCTFVSLRGNRCKASRFLEFDHVDPVAQGGKATVEKIRLRCRAHNQYEAERAFGAAFMKRKRFEARLTRVAANEERRAGSPRRTDPGRGGRTSQPWVSSRRGTSCRRVFGNPPRRHARGAHASGPEVSRRKVNPSSDPYRGASATYDRGAFAMKTSRLRTAQVGSP